MLIVLEVASGLFDRKVLESQGLWSSLDSLHFFFLISFQLAHPILESLKGTQHGWLIELLYAFNSGLFCSIFSFVIVIIIVQMFLCLRLCISITKA